MVQGCRVDGLGSIGFVYTNSKVVKLLVVGLWF